MEADLDTLKLDHEILRACPGLGSSALFGRQPAMILVEQGQMWLAAFRTAVRRHPGRRLRPSWVHVHSPEEATAALAQSSAACVVIESMMQTAARDVLQIAQWREAYPSSCVIAAVLRPPRNLRKDVELAFREAGAVAVLDSPRVADRIVPLLARHWQ